MTLTESITDSLDRGDELDETWREAGAAWGHAAADWAYLFEPYARDAADAVFDQLRVNGDTHLFDMACGAGAATARAARLGARVVGLDASEALIDIARRRTPHGIFDIGSMFNLPYRGECFDIVTSFNGIWGGCDDAVGEAARVLRPGGHIALTFWGPADKLDYRDMFITLGSTASSTKDAMIDMASIGTPGVAEAMLTGSGFDVLTRGETDAIHEFPDAGTMWRALRSPGLMKPALDRLGDGALRRLLMPTLAPLQAADGSYRVRNALTHVIARKPG